jgi:tellurite methyltransferase
LDRLALEDLDRPGGFALLDTRSEAAFAAGHLPGAGHVPYGALEERRSELPPRETAMLVLADDPASARRAAERLEGLGYTRVAWLDGDVSEAPAAAERGQPARLWRPSPFLEASLSALPPPGDSCRVLDLAAGAGREAVFLAMHGYHVEAWDHDGAVLEKARLLATRHGVRIETAVRNLERREPDLPIGDRHVVTAFRFLHRPLMKSVATAVAPGGVVVYETFLRGQERFGRPRHPRFLLDPGELPGHFPGFEVVRYEESTPPEGPWLARLLARKPS